MVNKTILLVLLEVFRDEVRVVIERIEDVRVEYVVPELGAQFMSAGRTRYILFWGVIFRGSRGFLYVRYLCWNDGAWERLYGWLFHGFGVGVPAASLASNT